MDESHDLEHEKANSQFQYTFFKEIIEQSDPNSEVRVLHTYLDDINSFSYDDYDVFMWTGGLGNIYLSNQHNKNQLKVCEKISDFLKENFVNDLTYFEKKIKMKIDIISDNSLIIPEYIIDIKNKSKKTIELIEYYEKLKNLETQNKEDKFSEKKENKKINKKI